MKKHQETRVEDSQHDQPLATASEAVAGSAHTPGPWRVDKVLYPAGQDVSFEVLAGKRLVVQTIMREVIAEDAVIAEDDANARLIAAAPDLLAALRELVSRCDDTADVLRNHPEYDAAGFLRASAERYRAVIAKAEAQ